MDIAVVEKLKTKFVNGLTKLFNEFWDLFPKDVSDEEVMQNLIIAYNATVGFVPFWIYKKDSSLKGFTKEKLLSKLDSYFVSKSEEVMSMGIETLSMDDSDEDSPKSMLTHHVDSHLKNMKNNIKKMQQILNDSSKNKSSKDGTLGIYAWPTNRIKDHLPYEKNTDEEELLSSELYAHFQNTKTKSVSGIDEKGASILKKMLANGEYPDIIREPKTKIIMRGMAVSDQELRSLSGGDYVVQGKTLKYSGIFIPKKSASSWTTSKTSAIGFAKENESNAKMHCIVLIAQVSENPGKLLQCDDALYKFDFAESVSDEHEVIALGNIKMYAIEVLK